MSILLEQLTKRYEGHPVVNHVSLEVVDGEFFVLLGPSGSGKSTVLRMIAGLSEIDQGRIVLHGRDVTHLPPQQRGVGFVFQNYALFRHMSVAENIEFGLRIRRVPAGERRRQRDELLELVGLAGLGSRKPHQLSGGQQQRVALARALAYQPEVLLLDEPFGALDAKIRVEVRRTLRRIQRELGITTIFVTHDQEEAFELADRLGVLNFGRLLEVGPTEELYHRPQTEFVAMFLGTANLLVGHCTARGVQVGALHFPLNTEAEQVGNTQRVQVLFRPEDITLAPTPEGLPGSLLGQGQVESRIFAGAFERLRLRLPPIAGVRAIAPPVPFGSDFMLIEATRTQDDTRRFVLQPGDQAWVSVRRIHALVHAGLSFLLINDGSPAAPAAIDLGSQMARLAHARVTLLGCGLEPEQVQRCLDATREQFGSGMAALEARESLHPPAAAVAWAVERQPYDLIGLGYQSQRGIEAIEQILGAGEHNLLLVPQSCVPPARALICVAAGEPGKQDVRFAGRLMRHLGAEVTLLSVLPEGNGRTPLLTREQAERFLAASVRTLSLLGVPAQTVVRSGALYAEIMAELAAGGYDLLVLGTPLNHRDGRVALSGVVRQILQETPTYPVLLVQSRYTTAGPLRAAGEGHTTMLDEVLP